MKIHQFNKGVFTLRLGIFDISRWAGHTPDQSLAIISKRHTTCHTGN